MEKQRGRAAVNVSAALIFRKQRITSGVLNLQYSTADYRHLWMFANVTSRLTERQLQSDLCVHNSGGWGGTCLGVYSLKTTQSMDKWLPGCARVSREQRADPESSWASAPAHVLYKRTTPQRYVHPGDKLFKEVWAGTNEALYKKKKGKSEQVWGFLIAAEVFVIICTCPTKRGKTPSVPAWNKGVHIWRLLPRYRRQTLCFGFEVAKIAFEICSYEQPLSMGKKRKSLSASTKTISWLMHVYRTFILNMIDGFKQTCNNPEVLLSPLHICWMHWQPS